MRPLDLRVTCGLLLALVITGCASADPEPDSAFRDLPPQAYPFDVVFESMAEAVQEQDFEIEATDRAGENAEFKTAYKMTGKDKITGSEESTRVRVRIGPAGEKKYSVALASSVFGRDTPADPWVYDRWDSDLHARIERSLAGIITRRYQGGGE